MLSTFLRRGEVCALKWSDIDGKRVTVSRARKVIAGVGLEESGTKSGRPHTLYLDVGTVRFLEEHRKAQAEVCVSEYVFAAREGKPMYPPQLVERFRVLCERAEVPKVRLHDLRHHGIILALCQGMPVKLVQDRAGHASSVITMDTYGAFIPEAWKQEEAERFGGYLFGEAARG